MATRASVVQSPGSRSDCHVSLLRCPCPGDNYRTRLIPVGTASGRPFPAHHQRFSIFAFSFVDPVASQALGGPYAAPGGALGGFRVVAPSATAGLGAGRWSRPRATLGVSAMSDACQPGSSPSVLP